MPVPSTEQEEQTMIDIRVKVAGARVRVSFPRGSGWEVLAVVVASGLVLALLAAVVT